MAEGHPDSVVIEALGGPSAVARIFGIHPQAVSMWKRTGIPKARRMYLKLAHPEAFEDAPPQEAASAAAGAQA
jgi:hypothetical protein